MRGSWLFKVTASTALATLVAGVAALQGNGPSADTVLGVEPAARVGGSGDNGSGKNSGTGNDKKDFTVSGSIDGLHPGAVSTLVLTLGNRNNFDIRVLSVDVAVAAVPACPVGTVSIEPFRGEALVTKNGRATVSVRASMAADAASECKDRTFPLAYSGKAVKA